MDTTQLCTIVKEVGFRLTYEPKNKTDTAYSTRFKIDAQLRTLKMDVTDHVNVRHTGRWWSQWRPPSFPHQELVILDQKPNKARDKNII